MQQVREQKLYTSVRSKNDLPEILRMSSYVSEDIFHIILMGWACYPNWRLLTWLTICGKICERGQTQNNDLEKKSI